MKIVSLTLPSSLWKLFLLQSHKLLLEFGSASTDLKECWVVRILFEFAQWLNFLNKSVDHLIGMLKFTGKTNTHHSSKCHWYENKGCIAEVDIHCRTESCGNNCERQRPSVALVVRKVNKNWQETIGGQYLEVML